MSAAAIVRATAANLALLDNVADDVFDEQIDATRREKRANTPGHLMVLALVDDEVVGMCTAMVHHHADRPDELFIDEVGVAPPFQRRGIARSMMQEMMTWGTELGCAEAWLGTEIDNAPARRLYESLSPDEADEGLYFSYKLGPRQHRPD